MLISAGGHSQTTGEETLNAGYADLIAYGRLHISNPDLPQRFAQDLPLAPYDRLFAYTAPRSSPFDR